MLQCSTDANAFTKLKVALKCVRTDLTQMSTDCENIFSSGETYNCTAHLDEKLGSTVQKGRYENGTFLLLEICLFWID